MFKCDICDRTFETEQGMKMHKGRSHKGELPHDADTLFSVVGAATAVLFPNGVPYERVIEVAEWQKATLRLMAR